MNKKHFYIAEICRIADEAREADLRTLIHVYSGIDIINSHGEVLISTDNSELGAQAAQVAFRAWLKEQHGFTPSEQETHAQIADAKVAAEAAIDPVRLELAKAAMMAMLNRGASTAHIGPDAVRVADSLLAELGKGTK